MAKEEFKPYQECIRQADYDFKTAYSLFEAGRYIYVIFMCHLAIEKYLKGFYAKEYKEDPPKTHNLSYLSGKTKLPISKYFQDFLNDLNDLSVPTRYPEELREFLREYRKDKSKAIIERTKELFKWFKKQLNGQK